jgi:P22 coat protein - gene protein 5.
MTLPTNILKQVITYNDGGLAYLQNLNCFVSTFNTKFLNFQNIEGNLGDTVQFDLPPRSIAVTGLVASFQPAEQRYATLACTQAANASMAFTAQQFVFNVKDYMEKFGKSRVEELSAQIESNVALNNVSKVPVMTVNNQGQSVPTGAFYTDSGPYRFYGDGVTPINSFGQLAQMLAMYRNYGAPNGAPNVYLDDLAVPSIVNSGLGQFVPARNDVIANSWDLGTYKGSNARFYQSNLLPTHTAGSVGDEAKTLTVVSTNDPTGANITEITFSGASASDSDALKMGDLLQFQDGVSGQPNLRYLTFTGHKVSGNPVQIRALSNDASTGGGQITVEVYPPLSSVPGPNQNLNHNIVAGMQAKALPSHRAGVIIGGNAGFLAMPRLPDESPYATGTKTDKDTGVSLRTYYGSLFGQNTRGIINDAIWNSMIVPEYSMRIIFPM